MRAENLTSHLNPAQCLNVDPAAIDECEVWAGLFFRTPARKHFNAVLPESSRKDTNALDNVTGGVLSC